MRIFKKKCYEVIEVCRKHGTAATRVFKNYFDALRFLQDLARKYIKHLGLYKHLGYKACIVGKPLDIIEA